MRACGFGPYALFLRHALTKRENLYPTGQGKNWVLLDRGSSLRPEGAA